MTHIHVWIGTFIGSEEDFNQYLEVDKVRVKLGVGGSQFDRDIGLNWYDEDHIGVYHSTTNLSLKAAVDEIIGASGMLEDIYNLCLSKGINEANTMLYYFNDDLEVVTSDRLSNGLVYIGVFEV